MPLLIEFRSISILGTEDKAALVRTLRDRQGARHRRGMARRNGHARPRADAELGHAAAAYSDPDYWDIEVDALLQAYARHARRHGAQILENRAFSGARREGNTWRIELNGETISAGMLVNAAGGWADRVAALSGVAPLGIVPHRRTAITVDLPDNIDASRLPEVNEVEEIFYFKPEGGRLLASPADATPCEPADVQPGNSISPMPPTM